MRAVKLHLYDCELFGRHLDGEKHEFFCAHLPAFKKMWKEEGKVYWVRFLITFKTHFEFRLNHRLSSHRLANFIFIFIHKQFVEGSYSTAKNFIDNIFMIAKHTPYLPETMFIKQFSKILFYSKECKEPFHALFGKPELDDEIPVGVSFVSFVYFEFASAICSLLKKWLQEPDLSEEVKNEIDNTLFYWRPSEWKDAGCFEKYLADKWKNDLPQMLLTSDIHINFSNHPNDWCNFEKDMDIFELLKDKLDPVRRFCIPHVEILKPSTDTCSAHSNCRRKILHDKKCLQPYLCEGSQPCMLTCEVSSKKTQQSKETNQANPWKIFFFETFACKEANRRTVSTLAESHWAEIETFYREKESTCELVKDGLITAEDAEDLLRLYKDGDLRNTLNQLRRKERLLQRLRSKLDKKINFDPENYKDPVYCWNLYQRAHQAWIHDIYEGKIAKVKELPLSTINVDEAKLENSLENLLRASKSVAVGTIDAVFGRVVYPSKLNYQAHTEVSVCEGHGQQKRGSIDKKSKKTKGNINGILSSKADNGSVNDGLKTTAKIAATPQISQNCETVPKNNIKFATAVDNPENCYEVGFNIQLVKDIKNSNKDMSKNGSSAVRSINFEDHAKKADAVVSLSADKEFVFKSCESLSESKVSELIEAASSNLQESTHVHYRQHNNRKSSSMLNSSSEDGSNKMICIFVSNGEDCEQLGVKKGSAESALNATISNDVKTPNNNAGKDQVNYDTVDDKYLALIGNTDYTSPQKPNTINDPAMNGDLQCSANGGTDGSGDSCSQIDDSTNNDILTLIGALHKPSRVPESKSSSKEPASLDSVGNDLTEKKRKLRICAFCGKTEVQSKTFKRCAKCKIEKFREQRYYCSRNCQLDDWKDTHREEHHKRTESLL